MSLGQWCVDLIFKFLFKEQNLYLATESLVHYMWYIQRKYVIMYIVTYWKKCKHVPYYNKRKLSCMCSWNPEMYTWLQKSTFLTERTKNEWQEMDILNKIKWWHVSEPWHIVCVVRTKGDMDIYTDTPTHSTQCAYLHTRLNRTFTDTGTYLHNFEHLGYKCALYLSCGDL